MIVLAFCVTADAVQVGMLLHEGHGKRVRRREKLVGEEVAEKNLAHRLARARKNKQLSTKVTENVCQLSTSDRISAYYR